MAPPPQFPISPYMASKGALFGFILPGPDQLHSVVQTQATIADLQPRKPQLNLFQPNKTVVEANVEKSHNVQLQANVVHSKGNAFQSQTTIAMLPASIFPSQATVVHPQATPYQPPSTVYRPEASFVPRQLHGIVQPQAVAVPPQAIISPPQATDMMKLSSGDDLTHATEFEMQVSVPTPVSPLISAHSCTQLIVVQVDENMYLHCQECYMFFEASCTTEIEVTTKSLYTIKYIQF